MSKALVPEQVKRAMASAAEDIVKAQLLLRCLQRPGWELVVGGFGHDFALLNTKTRERRTIEVKSRQAFNGLSRHTGKRFGVDLWGEQQKADFLIFFWFDQNLIFVKPTREMKEGFVKGVRRLSCDFLPTDDPALNAWDQLFNR